MGKIAHLDKEVGKYNGLLYSYHQFPKFEAAKLKYFDNLFSKMDENLFKNADEHVVILIFEFLNLKAILERLNVRSCKENRKRRLKEEREWQKEKRKWGEYDRFCEQYWDDSIEGE